MVCAVVPPVLNSQRGSPVLLDSDMVCEVPRSEKPQWLGDLWLSCQSGAQVLGDAYLFYEAQRSGALPPDNRIAWRGNSALQDSIGNHSLAGGWYDSGGARTRGQGVEHLELYFTRRVVSL